MYNGRNVALVYDGSFYGLLSAAWYALENKITPAEITAKRLLLPIFEEKEIETDEKKAMRLLHGIENRIFKGVSKKVFALWLSDRENKEELLLDYLRFGLSHGQKTARLLTEPAVCETEKTFRAVYNEAHRLKGFLRFSEFDGFLAAITEPSCNALPLIIGHFARRFPEENLLIYDKKHKLAALSQRGEISLFDADEFFFPKRSLEEKHYRILWREFYNTVAIKERLNEKCRKTHLPVRFWHQLTEMSEENDVNALNFENIKLTFND
ncbi:MAG: TIGR03915 family putative DNA repair protein [Clostridia bacterium]|nr:TIGR03915 family putative DNA repair protein [Clostridia bacterium]